MQAALSEASRLKCVAEAAIQRKDQFAELLGARIRDANSPLSPALSYSAAPIFPVCA